VDLTLDWLLANAFKIGIIAVIGGFVIAVFGTLSGSQQLRLIGRRIILIGFLLWGIAALYVFGFFFLH
jgi:hypothetical protein